MRMSVRVSVGRVYVTCMNVSANISIGDTSLSVFVCVTACKSMSADVSVAYEDEGIL